MVHRRTLQWMGRVLRMDEDRLPRQVSGCSLAKSVAEDGRMEQLKLRPGHRSINDFSGMYSSAIPGCHEEAAAERALDRQAWRDAIKNPAPLEFKKPQQVGRMTRSCVRRGGRGLCCATLPSVRLGSREDVEVIASGKASVKSKECVCVEGGQAAGRQVWTSGWID
eukprot:365327-Chlamydomonas_euryale.AAC.13